MTTSAAPARTAHWRFPALSAGLLVLALAAVATGLIPLARTLDVLERVWPVLLFLLLLKVVSDLLEESGLFGILAALLARAGRGRPLVLLGLVVALALACTTILSLDATAVLVTPIAIGLARREGLRTAPFLLACIWSAGVGSLLLPVSNLTNLLAQQTLGWPAMDFVRATWVLQIALAAVLAAVLLILFGGRMRSEGAGESTALEPAGDGCVDPGTGAPSPEPFPVASDRPRRAQGQARPSAAAAWAGGLGILGFALGCVSLMVGEAHGMMSG